VIEEIIIHEAMVAFWMLFWQADVFVHVERNNVFKADFASLVQFDQTFVGLQRGAAGWQTENKWALSRWFEGIDTVNNMTGRP
jgi:hypothetical protein